MKFNADRSAPMAEAFNLEQMIQGLCCDLESLRSGAITVPDAMARATLAKQICNAVRLQLNGMAYLSERAKIALPARDIAQKEL